VTTRTASTATTSRRAPVTQRTVRVKDCDDNDIRENEDQTLSGRLVVQDCPCQKRFGRNATRLGALAASVAKQLRTYFQKVYSTQINYNVQVRVLSGNRTHTVFQYIVKVPKAEHGRARDAMKQTCRDNSVRTLCFASHTETPRVYPF
jgi:hypothetical protein